MSDSSASQWSFGLDLLDSGNYISVNRTLVRKYGLNVAVVIGELASEARYWAKKNELNDGWFFSTVENIEDATGINAYYQREAIGTISELGFVEVAYRGIPRKRYFRLNVMKIIQSMSESDDIAGNAQSFTQCTTSDSPSERLAVHPVHDNNNNKQQQVTTTNNNMGKRKKKAFVPPTRDEVKAHVAEKGYHLDPDHFYDYYNSSNWHLQGGKKVSNWKQCCVTWERNAKKSPQRSGQTRQRSVDFEKKVMEYEEPRVGSMRYDNVTGVSETYQGNGVWVQTREGDEFEDIDF